MLEDSHSEENDHQNNNQTNNEESNMEGGKKRKGKKKTKTKTGTWIAHVKSFAKSHKLNFPEALKHPDCKKSYKKLNNIIF